MKCSVTRHSNFAAFSCCRKLKIFSLTWRHWKMDSNVLWRIITSDIQWLFHNRECKLDHLSPFPLRVLEIWCQDLTASRKNCCYFHIYKMVFWIHFPGFWESERHSQIQLNCKTMLNSDWAAMIFSWKQLPRWCLKYNFFSNNEWALLLLLAENCL